MLSEHRLHINNLINGGTPPQTNGVTTGHGRLRTEIVERFQEHGRDYYMVNREIVYPLPCDEQERNRLDCFHHILHVLALGGRLVTADLDSRGPDRPKVLDLGYGTGIWAIDMSERYPELDVYAIDLINDHPPAESYANNLHFHSPVDFTKRNWGFYDSSFDLIRLSQLCGCVPNWEQQYQIVSRHLKPGKGYIEHIEIDWTPRCLGQIAWPDSLRVLRDWWSYMLQASELAGQSVAYREDTERLLENAGFTDINHKIVRISLQPRSRDEREHELKRYFQAIMCLPMPDIGPFNTSFEALCMSLFTRRLRFSPEQVHGLCNAVREAYKTNTSPLYHNIHVWTARKPMG